MPIGVIIDAASVAIGGILGALAGHKLPAYLKTQLNIVLGLCSMGMGISSIGLMKNMPAVIFAIVLGSGIGLAVGLGGWINKGAEELQKPIAKVAGQPVSLSQEEFISTLVTVIVLFCASGTGIYGSLDAGMTSDNVILISKSILDLFTAAVFACNLGYVVAGCSAPAGAVPCAVLWRTRHPSSDHSGHDREFQSLRRLSDGGHRPAHDQNQGIPHRGYDSRHDSGHALQLDVDQLDHSAAWLSQLTKMPAWLNPGRHFCSSVLYGLYSCHRAESIQMRAEKSGMGRTPSV